MVDRLEKRNRLPAGPRLGVTLLTDLECEHQVQLRQPCLTGTLAREQNRSSRLRPNLRREGAESAHPIVTTADRVPVRRVPAYQRLDRLVHVDPVDAVVAQH